MPLLQQIMIFLVAAVVAVPISKRLGLGSVLGYLAAGVIIGPSCSGLINDVENVLHFAEFGVVLLLFIIGLELQPSRLWELRRAVFGYGGVQVVATGVILALAGMMLGLKPAAAVVAGFGLSLSSTAFALQLLAEKNQLATEHGRASFGILLFQDMAVIPLLALLPILGEPTDPSHESTWLMILKLVGVLIIVVGGGKLIVRPVFRIVAQTQSQEVFTATALLVVIGTALLVSQVGLSMALGAFLAGVLLAESEYKHELEADIEPFKGLLLGLFFIAVGMSLQVRLLVERPFTVLGLVLGLVAIKALVLFVMGRKIFKDNDSALSMAVAISQGGEFAFVLFTLAVTFKDMDRSLSALLIVVVGLSMALTPLLFTLHERVIRPRLKQSAKRDFDTYPSDEPPVIIAGFGRVGQIVARVLRAKRIPFTAMDVDPNHIQFVTRFGNKVFYGDASRLDLLRAAHADKAQVFVLAIDDVEASVHTAETVLQHFPHLKIIARARNRQHAYHLRGLGITHLMRETFASSLEMTVDVLESLGMSYADAHQIVEQFREHDEAIFEASYKDATNIEKLSEVTERARQELEDIFNRDVGTRTGS